MCGRRRSSFSVLYSSSVIWPWVTEQSTLLTLNKRPHRKIWPCENVDHDTVNAKTRQGAKLYSYTRVVLLTSFFRGTISILYTCDVTKIERCICILQIGSVGRQSNDWIEHRQTNLRCTQVKRRVNKGIIAIRIELLCFIGCGILRCAVDCAK